MKQKNATGSFLKMLVFYKAKLFPNRIIPGV